MLRHPGIAVGHVSLPGGELCLFSPTTLLSGMLDPEMGENSTDCPVTLGKLLPSGLAEVVGIYRPSILLIICDRIKRW